jgi:hypothetical protein
VNTKDRLDHLTQGLVGNNDRLYHESAYFKQMVDTQARLMLKMGDVLATDGREHQELMEAARFRVEHGFEVPAEILGELGFEEGK